MRCLEQPTAQGLPNGEALQIAEAEVGGPLTGLGRPPLEPGDEWIVCPDGTIVIVNRERSPRIIYPDRSSEDLRINHRNRYNIPSAVKLMTD